MSSSFSSPQRKIRVERIEKYREKGENFCPLILLSFLGGSWEGGFYCQYHENFFPNFSSGDRKKNGKTKKKLLSTYDSPAGERRKNCATAVGERDKFLGDDGPGLTLGVRKAIVGEEAHRGIRDEKAVEPAYNKRHRADHRPLHRPALLHTPGVANDTREAAAAAGKKSKVEGNDDNRRMGERRMEEAEERKTTTNESPSRDKRP